MKIQSMHIYNGLLYLVLFYQPLLTAAEQESSHLPAQKNFIQFGAEYSYSDNIYKTAENTQSSGRSRADVEVSYAQKNETNDIALNYRAEYTDESNNLLEDSKFWAGNGLFSQQIFTKNLLLGLSHDRERFVVDENIASLSSNETERDIFTIEPQLFIPYSDRSKFILSAAHSQARFHDFSSKNNESNTGQVSWQHQLNRELQLQFSYSNGEVEFDTDTNSYKKQQFNTQVSGSHRMGRYSLTVGKSLVDYQNAEYDGLNYSLTTDALVKQHLFILKAMKDLTDSSLREGNSNELDFFQNQLVWTTQISLSHQYTMLDDRLTNKSSIYFNKDQSISSIHETRDSNSQGINTRFDWPINEQWSAGLFVHYKLSDLYSGEKKKQIEASISSRYNFTDALYIQFRIDWEDQKFDRSEADNTEQNYATRIVFIY
ncbi:hypothetical protein [Psychromonas aquimarina]|uniref:hypothetical protein n=1 Tax=Psychromonas aquimarina TaxID=444919 RepID=UPI0004232FBC|nr:hypothetical protein [Psychromonas aquimarina]